jgi:hypothetical protein
MAYELIRLDDEKTNVKFDQNIKIWCENNHYRYIRAYYIKDLINRRYTNKTRFLVDVVLKKHESETDTFNVTRRGIWFIL